MANYSDAQHRKRYKTIELIVGEADWVPPPPALDTIVAVRGVSGEADLARAIKRVGGCRNSTQKVWELRYDQVIALNLVDRIVADVL